MQAETVYQTLFWIGALGVAVMGAMGAGAHGSHHGGQTHDVGSVHHGHDFAPVSNGHGHGHAGAQNHGTVHHHGHNHSHTSSNTHGHGDASADHVGNVANMLAGIMGILSPLTLFSVSLGAGATGTLLGTRFSTQVTAMLAIIAGLALFALVVRPMTKFVRRFASQPAQALAGVLASEAVSQNRFDADGRGIVNVTVDGQIVRLLAALERDDHRKGVVVAPGEKLVVTQIDEAKNTCRVTKL